MDIYIKKPDSETLSAKSTSTLTQQSPSKQVSLGIFVSTDNITPSLIVNWEKVMVSRFMCFDFSFQILFYTVPF